MREHDRTLRAWNDGFFRGGHGPGRRGHPGRVLDRQGDRRTAAGRVPERRAARSINYNDEFLYYVLGEPNQFVYPTGQRIYEQWTPRVLRGTTAVPQRYDGQILGGSFAVWCDLADSQTAGRRWRRASGCRCGRLTQKLWDPRAAGRCRGRSSGGWRTG